MGKCLFKSKGHMYTQKYLFSYPSSFIENQFQKFFIEYIHSSSFVPFITNEQQFFHMQHKLMDQPTLRQSQVAIRAATADVDNDQTDEQLIKSKETTTTKPVETKSTNYEDKLIVHLTYEKRFSSLPRDIHRVYENVFRNTNAMTKKLIVGNRNRRDAQNQLIHKRPKRSILQCKIIKNKYLKFLGK